MSNRRKHSRSRQRFADDEKGSRGSGRGPVKNYTFPETNRPANDRPGNYQTAGGRSIYEDRTPYTSPRAGHLLNSAVVSPGTTPAHQYSGPGAGPSHGGGGYIYNGKHYVHKGGAAPVYSYERPPDRRNSIKLRFNPLAFLKLVFMCHNYDVEVGGYGVSRSASDLLYVEELILIKQTSTSAHMEFDDADLANYYDDVADQKRSLELHDRLWFHTHPVMSANPSGTDENTFASKFTQPWAVMAIFSKTNDCTARLKYNSGPGIERDLDWEVDWSRFPDLLRTTTMSELETKWKQEFTEKVNVGGKASYVPGGYGSSGYDYSANRYNPKEGYWNKGVWTPYANSGAAANTAPATAPATPPAVGSKEEAEHFFQQLKTGTTSTPSQPGTSQPTETQGNTTPATGTDTTPNTGNGGTSLQFSGHTVPTEDYQGDDTGFGDWSLYDFNPNSDADIFHRYVTNRDWLLDEGQLRYQPRDTILHAHGNSHDLGVLPAVHYEDFVNDLWKELVTEFAAYYHDIAVPVNVLKHRSRWIEDDPTEDINLVPAPATPATEGSTCPAQPQPQDQPPAPVEAQEQEQVLPFPHLDPVQPEQQPSTSPTATSGSGTSSPTPG